MKPHYPKTLFIFYSHINPFAKPCKQSLFQVSHFSASSSNPYHSSPNPSYPSRRHDEESRNVRVSVWWDFENCSLPAGANAFRVAQSITAAIRGCRIRGPIQITAFGDVMQLSRANQEALSSTGINLIHIPHGGKNGADRSLLADLMYWISQNPPPAHLFLISGDRDFASILHRLRMNNYNILLAGPENAPGVLCSAASIMWQWNALVRGENLNGKHFNQPPDGPYGSWYGHYSAPLADPFAVTEHLSCFQVEELSDSSSDPKLRQIPKVVVKHIRHILDSHPKGIFITDLRAELAKSNVSLDKDLYGYKKFSRFLLAIPHILKLHSGGDGKFFVRGVAPEVPDQVESTPGMPTGPVTDNGEPDIIVTPKLNAEDTSCTGGVGKTKSLPLTVEDPPKKLQVPTTKVQEPKARVQEPPEKVQEPPKTVQETAPLGEVINYAKAAEDHSHPVQEHDSLPKVGFVKRIWRIFFRGRYDVSDKKSGSQPENCSAEKMRTGEKCVNSASQSAESIGAASFSSVSNASVMDEKINVETSCDKSIRSPIFRNQIWSSCKFWKTTSDSNHSDEHYREHVNQTESDSQKLEVFSKESFWNDLEAFMDTPEGSDLFLQSKTRCTFLILFYLSVPLAELKDMFDWDISHASKQGVIETSHHGDLVLL
ncbi:unnamed protein product [Ilex paraguariensis]|uniref:HTH OST-type domain-containing protein n=1 Tax=Ilex paraguariensis TaxID=185542 RepID=A0ABC8R7N4_9AQUA